LFLSYQAVRGDVAGALKRCRLGSFRTAVAAHPAGKVVVVVVLESDDAP
jgi:hypothetical protein